ncbi:MAG: Halocyanin precursor [Methanocella sp. PtaU1.Bin125]|nr:MAG: Halocyanin precursor [Methanocella sp. PtaU1.Bin125]
MRLPKIMGSLVLITAIILYAAPVVSQDQSTAQVTIINFAFDPGTVTIARGDTVSWTNQDSTVHTVKFGSDESSAFRKGQSYSRTFNDAGTFDYVCGIHPGMKGKVIVT